MMRSIRKMAGGEDDEGANIASVENYLKHEAGVEIEEERREREESREKAEREAAETAKKAKKK